MHQILSSFLFLFCLLLSRLAATNDREILLPNQYCLFQKGMKVSQKQNDNQINDDAMFDQYHFIVH